MVILNLLSTLSHVRESAAQGPHTDEKQSRALDVVGRTTSTADLLDTDALLFAVIC